MTTTKEGNMSDSMKEKRAKIAQEIGWTPRRVQGYEDGRFYQQSGHGMPWCHEVDMDEYSKGFRTGYYAQACSLSISNIRETLRAV
jgi:hypothetical protein